jgi:hypothetical protein
MITVECDYCKVKQQYPKSLIGQKVKCKCENWIDIVVPCELLPDAPVSFDDFLGLFYHDLENIKLANNNSLDLYTLKIQNNDFAYTELIEILRNVLIPYVLSRNTRSSYANKTGTLSKRAREKFRNYWVNNKKEADKEGELGELLLYAFLESHLKAPKILSKYEIKTANNDYIKGADGVHLLKLNDSDYHLIFGESKLYDTLKGGIDAGFESIIKFLINRKDGYETHLVDTELFKEAYDEKLYVKLKQILLPSKSIVSYNLDHAFGMFIGFNYEIDSETRKASNTIARQSIRENVKNIVNQSLQVLNEKLNLTALNGYSFYVYAVPFSDLTNKRKKVIEEIIS